MVSTPVTVLSSWLRTTSGEFRPGTKWNTGTHTDYREGTCSEALYSTDAGYAYATGNDFGTCSSGNEADVGTLTSPGYSYTLDATTSVKSIVTASAGPNMTC